MRAAAAGEALTRNVVDRLLAVLSAGASFSLWLLTKCRLILVVNESVMLLSL